MIERVDVATDARLADYRVVRDPELVRRSACFVAEGRRVVETLLLRSPLEPVSVLVDEAGLAWLEREVADGRSLDVPVYVAERGLGDLGGWNFHQGCLALGRRPAPHAVRDLLATRPEARWIAALDGVSNPDNVGAVFRTAAAFGCEAVVLSPGCASPLYRKAIRTSMGTALTLPFAQGTSWEDDLAALAGAGFRLLGLSPEPAARDLETVRDGLAAGARRALVLGAEGSGLGPASRAAADDLVRIAMPGGLDSLNVAAAAAVALYRLRPGPPD